MVYLNVDKNIKLRLLDFNDSDKLYFIINQNRNHLKRYLSWVKNIKKKDDVLNFIEESREQFASDKGFHLCIWYKNKLVGIIGHDIDDEKNSSEIGYWLIENYQGKGIITKSCEVLIDYLFSEFDLNKIEINCALDNKKSIAIPEKLGFKKEGIIRDNQFLNGKYIDHVVYGKLKKEW
ncbi:MAG: GNAT family N-acetyltransferase [Firmicutes bacterium]|nr:GNAT family N-acetyltransferase [Bacillota bacterium]